jgi:NAD(P)H dehydrogenase (quinone)
MYGRVLIAPLPTHALRCSCWPVWPCSQRDSLCVLADVVCFSAVFCAFVRSSVTLAKHVAKGVEAAGGEVSVFQVAETLSEEVLGKMHAPAKDASVPIISNPADLEAYDGIIFGSDTRYGAITAQLKAFFDKSGQVWAKEDGLARPRPSSSRRLRREEDKKPRRSLLSRSSSIMACYSCRKHQRTCTAHIHCGRTPALGQIVLRLELIDCFVFYASSLLFLLSVSAKSDPSLFNTGQIHGGSPWGAGTIAGPDGSHQSIPLKLKILRTPTAQVLAKTSRIPSEARVT